MSQPAVRACVLATDGSEDERLAAEAKEVIDRCFQPGLGAERCVEVYDSNSDKYDQVSIKLSRTQELCGSRGGRPGLPSLISLWFLWMYVKQHSAIKLTPYNTVSRFGLVVRR